MLLWNLCRNEQGVSCFPVFQGWDLADLPWDVAQLYTIRKHLDGLQFQLSHYKGRVPQPTPRTLDSSSGFALWCKWAENTEDDCRDRGKTFWETMEQRPFIEGYDLRFDYIEWDRAGELVMYCTDWRSSGYLDIIPLTEIGARCQDINVRILTPSSTKEEHQSIEQPVFGTEIRF